MKTYTGFYYQVSDKKNNSHYVEQHETLEEAKQARKEAQQRQKAAGYTPSEEIIIQVMWQRVFDENGDFIAETTAINRINE